MQEYLESLAKLSNILDGWYDCQENMLDWGKKMSQIYRGELHDENIFAFFVLMNFQLSAKHFSVLPWN